MGKTTLLERLKVTEIPTRVKSRGVTKDVATRLEAEPLTATLNAAFIETGAQEVPQRGRSSTIIIQSKTNSAAGTAARSGQAKPSKKLIATPPSTVSPTPKAPSSAVKATPKKRFNFCPAPERYLKSRDDDDDGDGAVERADSDMKNDEKEHLLEPSSRQGAQQQHIQDDIRNEALNSSNHSTSSPPPRVRCHSKEFDVHSLDLMNGRKSSLEDIPIDRDGSSSTLPPPPSQQQQQEEETTHKQNEWNSDGSSLNTSKGVSRQFSPTISPRETLQQHSAEEYHLKPNGKMLPLKMIRPTSKFYLSV